MRFARSSTTRNSRFGSLLRLRSGLVFGLQPSLEDEAIETHSPLSRYLQPNESGTCPSNRHGRICLLCESYPPCLWTRLTTFDEGITLSVRVLFLRQNRLEKLPGAIIRLETSGKEASRKKGKSNPGMHERRYSRVELVKRVFWVDSLRFERCGVKMRIVCALRQSPAYFCFLSDFFLHRITSKLNYWSFFCLHKIRGRTIGCSRC